MGLALCVHFHLARARAAAHADVLERAAVARLLMPLEVREGDDDVRVHQGSADLRVFHILAANDRNLHIVAAAQTVGNDHMAARRERRKAV